MKYPNCKDIDEISDSRAFGGQVRLQRKNKREFCDTVKHLDCSDGYEKYSCNKFHTATQIHLNA